MRVLDLFSGIGGFAYAQSFLKWKTQAFSEIDPYCIQLLGERFEGVLNLGDVQQITEEALYQLGDIDIICGGFPCTDISVAGKGAGLDGTQSKLWWEMWRIISLVRPRWVHIENSSALRTRGADQVLNALEELGYTSWSFVVGAEHVGASHRRNRAWIISYDDGGRLREQSGWSSGANRKEETFDKECLSSLGRDVEDEIRGGDVQPLDNSDSEGHTSSPLDGIEKELSPFANLSLCFPKGQGIEQFDWEPTRMKGKFLNPIWAEIFMGYPMGWTEVLGAKDSARIKALGNSVVPQVVFFLSKSIEYVDKLLGGNS